MLAVVLNDALLFAATPQLAATLLANRHFSAVADGIVARRTLRAVWIRHGSPQVHISTAFLTPTGSTSFQAVTLSASDDVDNALRPLRLGGIVEVFRLQTRALADRWFVDVLSSLVVGSIVSRTLRLHLSNDVSIESIYALVKRFHYVEAVEVHYDKAWLLDFKVVDHDAHRSKCDKLGIRQVQFFDNGIITAPREVPLGIQRIVAVLEKAPSTYGLGVQLSMDNLFAAYRKEFVADISEPEKLCSVFALREDDARRILQTCSNVRTLNYAHLSSFESIVDHARPRVFEVKQGNVCLPSRYKDVLAKWKQGSST